MATNNQTKSAFDRINYYRLCDAIQKLHATEDGALVLDTLIGESGIFGMPDKKREESNDFFFGRRSMGLLIYNCLQFKLGPEHHAIMKRPHTAQIPKDDAKVQRLPTPGIKKQNI